jgi:hypothetical protein
MPSEVFRRELQAQLQANLVTLPKSTRGEDNHDESSEAGPTLEACACGSGVGRPALPQMPH